MKKIICWLVGHKYKELNIMAKCVRCKKFFIEESVAEDGMIIKHFRELN